MIGLINQLKEFCCLWHKFGS